MDFLHSPTILRFLIIVMSLLILISPLLLRLWVHFRVHTRVYELGNEVPATDAAIILGAGLWKDGSPTPVLYDRVITGVHLYSAGRVKFLLMSGDGGSDSYNEPAAMLRLAIELGMPEEKVAVDFAGLRTYESLIRARRIHNLDQVTIVTQQFHIERALYIADAIGLHAVGVTADRRRYHFWPLQRGRLREVIATARAWWDIRRSKSNADQRDEVLKNTSV